MSLDFIPGAKGSQVQGRVNRVACPVSWFKTITASLQLATQSCRDAGRRARGPRPVDPLCPSHQKAYKATGKHPPWTSWAQALIWGHTDMQFSNTFPLILPRIPSGLTEPVITTPARCMVPRPRHILGLNKHLLNWNELSRQALRRYKFCYWRRLTARQR